MRIMLAKSNARRVLLVVLMLHAGIAWGKKHDKSAVPVDPTLVVGDSYTIRSERHGVRQQLEGQLVKVNDRWIVLHRVTKGQRARSVPVLSVMPGIGQKFRMPAAPGVDEYLWIPREAAMVEAHARADGSPGTATALGESPALQVSCAVELAQAEHVVRREGGLEAMSEQSLTLAVPRKVTVDAPSPVFALAALFTPDAFGRKKVENRYTREQHARGDILCIRVANFDPSLLTARAR
jgi:hypothetical protein